MSDSPFEYDPIELFDTCLASRKEYQRSLGKTGVKLLASVVRWRWANDNMLPVHPLFHEIDTSEEEGPWKLSKRKWLATKPKKDYLAVKIGLNEAGEIVAMFRPRGAQFLVVRGDGYFDVLAVNSDLKKKEISPTRHHDAWFDRYFHEENGRLIGAARCDGTYLSTVTFFFEGERVVESKRQMYNRDDRPFDEKHKVLLADGTRKSLHSSKLVFSYAANGALQRAVVHRDDSDEIFTEAYALRKDETLESVTKNAVAKISEAVVDHFAHASISRPLHRIVLVYSAEHAHCGLPTRVAYLCGKSTPEISDSEELFELENDSYQWLEWPLGPRRVELGSLTDRLVLMVEELEGVPGGDAPLPFREMLWKTCRQIHKEFSKTKIAAKDFIVYPLDDHGDVDAEEDLRQSVPSRVAKRILGQ